MFNTNCKKFEEILYELINNSGLTIAEAYYIVENAALQLKLLYMEGIYKEKYGEIKTEETETVEIPNQIQAEE